MTHEELGPCTKTQTHTHRCAFGYGRKWTREKGLARTVTQRGLLEEVVVVAVGEARGGRQLNKNPFFRPQ